MGSWWRSEDMTYVNLIMTEEAAQSCVRELGAIGCIQFVDLNPDLTPFQRQFVSYIKRCDEVSHIPDGWLHVTKCIQQEVAYSFGFTDEITNILAVNIMRNALEIFPEDLYL